MRGHMTLGLEKQMETMWMLKSMKRFTETWKGMPMTFRVREGVLAFPAARVAMDLSSGEQRSKAISTTRMLEARLIKV